MKKHIEENEVEIYKNTVRKMMHILRLHRAYFERNISAMGIHHSQHHLLMYIVKHGEINSQKEIAEKFNITPAAVARSLKSLEQEGYITRHAIDGDGRYNKITVTEKGIDIAERSFKMFKETDESLFEDFDEDDIIKLNAYLDKMQSKLLERQRTNDEEK